MRPIRKWLALLLSAYSIFLIIFNLYYRNFTPESNYTPESNCTNADYPDMYGHYREHDVVQIKHHWFWKISYVFEELKVVGGLRDLQVLFLEEDHFVMPDAIQVLRKLSEKYKAFRLNYEIKIGEQIRFSDEIPIITG